jgi:hypothetical protein
MNKNAVTIQQIEMACRHAGELMTSDVSENTAVKTLHRLIDVYCKRRLLGYMSPDHADDYQLWSRAARQAKASNPGKPYGQYLRVEHGTPRRHFVREVLAKYRVGGLTKDWLDDFCDKYWKVAVITHEEDERLRRLARSQAYPTPEERWAGKMVAHQKGLKCAANIQF